MPLSDLLKDRLPFRSVPHKNQEDRLSPLAKGMKGTDQKELVLPLAQLAHV